MANVYCCRILSSDGDNDTGDLVSRLVMCYTARVCSHYICTNVAPGHSGQFDGHTLSSQHCTSDIRDSINSLGGIQVLFPLLETSLGNNINSLEDLKVISL